jgi:hypothetical protein
MASLAFAFEEGTHINVWKNRLDELGLPTGPWLTKLKEAGARGGTRRHFDQSSLAYTGGRAR